ncbi:MAG TPA: hypothetical protein VJM50_22860 [Pyrinomonadaceae bacterium]|nr:hypothetical protein [Pyrinomonadaceae bacterium]
MLLIVRSIVLIALYLLTSCAQSTEPSKLIDEINTDNAKARDITQEAERKRSEARAKGKAGEHSESASLYREASKLYAEISKLLRKNASKADEVAKVRDPSWYSEYFTSHAKRFRHLATMASGAAEQLMVNSNGQPSESQLKSWKADAEQLTMELDEVDKKIEEIEAREKVVLIK